MQAPCPETALASDRFIIVWRALFPRFLLALTCFQLFSISDGGAFACQKDKETVAIVDSCFDSVAFCSPAKVV